MIGHSLLQVHETGNLQAWLEDCVCTWGPAISALAGGVQSAFAFTFGLHTASKSAGSERCGPFLVFPGRVHSPANARYLLDSQSFPKPSVDVSVSNVLFLSFWSVPSGVAISGNCSMWNNWHVFFFFYCWHIFVCLFTNAPGIGLLEQTELCMRLRNNSLERRALQGAARQVK